MESEEEDRKKIHDYYYIPLIILIVMMFIISLFFFIVFIKSKAFKKYQCYNLIIFILVILIDCLIRIIPFSDDDHSNINIFEYLQAFLLVFFDKIILATLTTQIILFYIGVIHTKTFKNNDKKTFFISFVINIVVSFSLSIIYIGLGGIRLTSHRRYLYCNTSKFKDISDPIFNTVYLIPNLYCSLFLIRYLFRKKKEIESGLTEDYDYIYNLKKTIIMTLLNIITFLESYLIIFDILKGEKTDIIYLSTLLLICLFNCCNEAVMKEAMKIFCINKYKQRYGNDNEGEEETDEDVIHSRTYEE